MSVTISNCDEISKSPTNTSPSKQLYTFPKSARFNSRKLLTSDRFYDLPSTVSNCRTTSLGFGQKYDFTHNAPKNPPPNAYEISSTFSPSKTMACGFGKGREQMEATGPLANVRINKNPGPGTYDMNSTLSKSAYSLTKKPQEEDKEKMNIPGPGTYPVTFTINQKGFYYLSKYKNSCTRDFSKSGGRPQIFTSKVPGPGSYNSNSVNISPSGRYAISRMKNCLTRKFAITTRRPIADNNQNPGPGSYKLPSDFGHYASRKVFQEIHGHGVKKQQMEKQVVPVDKSKTEQTHVEV